MPLHRSFLLLACSDAAAMSTLANGQWETPVLGSNTKFINACSCTSSIRKASALECHWSLPLSPAIHNLDFGYFATSNQQGEHAPEQDISRSLRFQGSSNLRAGVFLAVSVSCIRMWDLLISVIRSPHLTGHWWCLSLDFFLICRAHLKFCNLKYLSFK